MRRVSQQPSDSSASSLGLTFYIRFRERSCWQERLEWGAKLNVRYLVARRYEQHGIHITRDAEGLTRSCGRETLHEAAQFVGLNANLVTPFGIDATANVGHKLRECGDAFAL